jgi:hypothetical protein
VSSRARQKDIQCAEDLNAKTVEIQNIMSAELATLKHESTTVLTQVRRELATAKRERDILKQLLGLMGTGWQPRKKRKRNRRTMPPCRNRWRH